MRSDSSCLTLNPPTMSLWPSLQPAESVPLSHGPQGLILGLAGRTQRHVMCTSKTHMSPGYGLKHV